MADYPALPLWTDKYFADTRHLSRDQHGAYLLLLMEAWRRPTCALPDDDGLLARLTCSTPDEWLALKPVIMAFWSVDGRSKEWKQKALTKEREYLTRQSRLQKDRAVKRWNKTELPHTGTKPDESRIDAPTPTPTPTQSLRDIAPQAASTRKRGTRLTEDWVLPMAFGDWALDQGLPRERILIEAEKMRDWSINAGKLGVKVDWMAAWRGWVRRALDEKPGGGKQMNGTGKPTRNDVLRQIRERLNDGHPTDERSAGPLGDDVRLIPFAERSR